MIKIKNVNYMKKYILNLALLLLFLNPNFGYTNNIINTNTTNVSMNNSRNDIMFLKTMYFDFNSYELTLETKQNLNLLLKYLLKNNNKNKMIVLSGYCDNIGTDEYNYNLGLKRVIAVKNYLLEQGVEQNRISIISFGKEFERKVTISIN